MPLIILLALLPVVIIAATPLLLIQRYRVGTSRRPARQWLAVLAIVSFAMSATFLLITSALTTIWVAEAFTYAALGLAAGCFAGVAGLVLTRWEATHRSLHFTPNRWLVLIITLVVSARVLLGLYRSLLAAQAGVTGHGLVAVFGVDESLGAGGIVIGYYLAYNAGLLWRIRRWQRRPLRAM